MNEEKAKELISRFQKRFYIKGKYYSMDYGSRFNPTKDPKTNKIKYKRSPGDINPFWFCNHQPNHRTYDLHITKTLDTMPVENRGNEEFYKSQLEEHKKDNEVDIGIILPPCDLNGDSETKGMACWGAFDEDVYKKPEHLKRIVKQIYDEKLPLAPCFSKSGGLHVYVFFKELVSGDSVVKTLEHFKKKLKATAKEINPKQTKPTWDKKKKRWSPGNGILIPYRSSILVKYVPPKKGSIYACGVEYSFLKPDNGWIQNENMETGSLEDFLNYSDTIELDQGFFESLPLDLPKVDTKEEKTTEENKKEEEETTEEKINFEEPNARPLSEKNPLFKIIQNIKKKKDHHKGGTFDNHVVDFVYGAVESKLSDKHILEHLEKVKKFSDKAKEDNYFKDKINNCRDKYDKADPGPLREGYMEDTIYILNAKTKKYYNKKTRRAYDKESYNVKFADIFPKKIEPTDFFKDHPKKQLAEEETYRPDLHKENDPLMKGADELFYLNSYKPGKIKPIKPETEGDIKPWNDLLEHVVPIKKEREFLLDWLAHIVQNPWVKNKVIILIYSKKQRFGKGSIFDTMTDILGETNAEPTDVKGVLDKGVTFAEKQLILVDECKSTGEYTEKRNLVNDLKKVATETRIQQRRLYVDYQIIETQTCYLVFTNESDALQMDKEDERYMVIKNENNRLDNKFYKAYHKWRRDKGSSYVFYMLKTRDISKFNPNEPAPHTKAKAEMQEETGHPLTLKLKEMLEEGRYPLTLDTKVISTFELSEYIAKYHRGKHVKSAQDKKQMKRSLIEIGGKDLGQVYHKTLNWKPTLVIIRDHDNLNNMTNTKICNEIWKPISSHTSPGEKHEDIATDNFNKNQMNGAEVFEKRFETNCWACGSSIDTNSNEKCPECNFAIKCDCGKCACDNPKSKVKKKGIYA